MAKALGIVLIIMAAAFIGPNLLPSIVRAEEELPARSKRHPQYSMEGTVYDDETGKPIPHVTVQVTGSGRATKTNADGKYRIFLSPGSYQIRVSHVGYYSRQDTVAITDSSVTRDVRLKISVYNLGERSVFTRAYDPAQRIIAEAIRRKKDILSQINDYSFDAYSKIIITNADKPDSENILLIAESRSTSYWEQPDKYKEVITGRFQSANIPADANLVSVGEMLNFNRNRIDLGRYDVVSPTAHDAMDHYNYYLLDTVYIDDREVFVLEVEPKNEYLPLFVGEIQIADSTFDVVKVDVGFSKGIQFPMIDSARYHQSMAFINNRYWLPIEIGFSGLATFDIPFPGIPQHIGFTHIASIYEYRIDQGHTAGTFNEYEIEVDEKADDYDSTEWTEQRMIPLSDLDRRGYERIDSVKNAPKPIYKKALKMLAIAPLVLTVGNTDLFHFNRVEGPYAGIGLSPDSWLKNARFRLKGGYSFDNELWQYAYGASYQVWPRYKIWLRLMIKDEIVHRPTIVSSASYNSTTRALLFKIDPLDYHRERGWSVGFSIKPVTRTRLKADYHDYRQSTQVKNTDYSVFRNSVTPRSNPPIIDGTMRSVTASVRYDSRKLIKNKRRDIISNSRNYLRLETGFEYASPHFISNDFNFRRYYVRAESRLMIPDLGTLRGNAYAGSSDGELPPQRYFIADFRDPDFFSSWGFNTFKETNFAGDRIAMVYAVHDFGTHMFRNTGDRYLKTIPFGLSFHGGVFWSEFAREQVMFDRLVCSAPAVYGEVGFGLNNLTPFLMPFNLSVNFTWQLSDYNTDKFSYMIDFRL